jgi:type II secretory pathway predicted ATPase ExeA
MKKLWFLFLFVLLIQIASFGIAPAAQENFDEATTHYLLGELDAALVHLRDALKIEPDYPAATRLMQSILREKGLYKEEEIKPAAPEAVPAPVPTTVPAPAPAPPQKAEREQWTLLARLITGVIGLAALLSWLILSGRDALVARMRRQETAYCSNCKHKLPRNVDTCPNCGATVGLKMWKSISEEQKFWYKKFGWTRNPFTIDIHYELFTGYESQVKEILGKINSRSGHILITGPLGVGKTTLLRWLNSRLPRREFHTVYISRPPVDFKQFVRHIFESMGYSFEQAAREADLYNLDKLRREMNKSLILLLDEAHEFTIEVERPLRTLGDLDGVNLIMAGLPETEEKIKNEIKPLYDRLVLKVVLDHLEYNELRELIKVRIESAGGKGIHPITSAAMEKLYEISKGNPRMTLKICDSAVAHAINAGEESIGLELIQKVANHD